MTILRHLFSDVRKGLGFVCCLILCGPLLLGIGIWQYVAGPFNTQSQGNVRQMNMAIGTWMRSYYPPFQNQNFYVYNPYLNQTVSLLLDQTRDLTSQGLNSYSPLKYSYQAAMFPNKTWSWEEKPAEIKFNDGALFFNESIFRSVNTTDIPTLCIPNGGMFINSTHHTPICTYFYVASDICVKVSSGGSSITPWKLNSTYGGFGCWFGANPGLAGTWLPFNYTKIPYNGGTVFNRTYSFQSMTVTIRNQEDPFVFAEWLTQGTLQFGLTPAQKAMIGIVLICIGAFFTLPMLILVIIMCYCCSTRRKSRGYERIQ